MPWQWDSSRWHAREKGLGFHQLSGVLARSGALMGLFVFFSGAKFFSGKNLSDGRCIHLPDHFQGLRSNISGHNWALAELTVDRQNFPGENTGVETSCQFYCCLPTSCWFKLKLHSTFRTSRFESTSLVRNLTTEERSRTLGLPKENEFLKKRQNTHGNAYNEKKT